MNCRTARKMFWTYADRALADAERRELEAHRSACTPCAESLRELEQAHAWLAELPVAEPADNFDWRLKLRLSKLAAEAAPAWNEARRFAWRPSLQFAASAAVAAALVLAIGLSVLRLESPSQQLPQPVAVRPVPSVPLFVPGAGAGARVEPLSSGSPVLQPLPMPYRSLFNTGGEPASGPDSIPQMDARGR